MKKYALKYFIPVLIFSWALISEAHAASRFWIYDTADGDSACTGLWSELACWSGTSGGSKLTTGSVPGSSDAVTFDASGTGNCTLSSNTTVSSLTTTNYTGVLDIGTTTFTTSGNFTLGANTLDADAATLKFTGSSSTIDVSTSFTMKNFTVAKNAFANLTVANDDTLIVTATTTLTSGKLQSGNSGSGVEAQGDVSFESGFTDFPNGKITFTGDNNQTCTGNHSTSSGTTTEIVINKTGGTLTFDGTLRVTKNFTHTAGTVAHTANAKIVFRNMIVNAPASSMSFNDVDIEDASATLAAAIDINDDLSISADGTLEAGTPTCYDITVGGDFTFTSGGVFNRRTCTVTLDGTNQAINGSPTFYNFSKSVNTADTLTIEASKTVTITNNMTFQGASGAYLALRSSVAGTQFGIDQGSNNTMDYCDLKDADGVGGTITTTNSYHSGNVTDITVDPGVSFSASSQSVAEAVGTVTVTATLPEVPSSDVTIPFTVSGSATASGTDHNLADGNITILSADNVSTGTTTFTVTADTIDESDETVILTMGTPTNAVAISPTLHTVTITDDDSTPGISVNDVSAVEGSSIQFTVSLSNASSQTITVDYATANGTATTADSDYTATSGTLTFTAGQTTKTVDVSTASDSTTEGDETFVINLSNVNANATISDSQGTGTITDSGSIPTISIDNVSATEGNTFQFTVSLNHASIQTITVDYATANETASSSSDYTATSGTVTFAALETSKTISVTTADDSLNEIDETFVVNLSNVNANATISDSQGTGTLTNNDTSGPKPRITIDDVSATEGNTLQFTVLLNRASTQTITVDYATANGTATTSSDYTANSGTLTFAALETSKTVSVSTTDDSTTESDETFVINLSNVNANATINDSQGTGTITDNDTESTLVSASAGSDRRMNAGESITLSGSGTGSSISYSWTIISGNTDGVASLGSATSASSTLSVSQSARSRSLTLRLTVTDGSTSATDDAVVTVNRYLEAVSIQTETQSNLMVVGSVGGYTVYERRTQIRGSEAHFLEIGFLTLTLPSGYSSYTIDETSTGRMMVGIQFPSGRSQVFLATESTGTLANLPRTIDLSELADLAVSKSVSKASSKFESDLLPAVLSASSSDPFLILERNESDGFASYLGTGDINGDGEIDIAIAAPGCGFNGCIYLYNQNYVLTGLIFGSSNNPIYSLVVQNLFTKTNNAFLVGPDNPGIKKNLQVGSTLTVKVAVSKSFALNEASSLTGEVQLSSTGVDASLSPDANIQTTAVGDYNADGNQDVALATTNGAVYIINGPLVDGTVYSEDDAAVVISNGSASDGFGQSLAFKDVTGDGYIDLLIGAPTHNNDTGILYVIPGGTTWSSTMNVNDEKGIIQVPCESSGDRCFAGIFLRDTNSDGIDEIFTTKSTSSVYKVDLYGSINTNPGDEFSFDGGGGCSLSTKASSKQMLLFFLILLVGIKKSFPRKRKSRVKT
ncbi:MAG: hypothetical protein A3I05_08160 [Deltaproteobacteria bacterium RIFCSPLOWO2_02_FULL_44_10]|nr:MAG: hypothetical protein A3C46_05045 [Deltaproteobacteria bacterium RIFCSPHIGHO2_02_FULL_44_16]OGQ45933.1 MAG: hypothetical protein A3I05_08160 [Deltaproteobacteria bacterium RIFCSPLOWO2_02_FULL_44_10]